MNANHHSESRTEYWQQQVNAWSQTDLSGAKFCQAQGLVYHQFGKRPVCTGCTVTT